MTAELWKSLDKRNIHKKHRVFKDFWGSRLLCFPSRQEIQYSTFFFHGNITKCIGKKGILVDKEFWDATNIGKPISLAAWMLLLTEDSSNSDLTLQGTSRTDKDLIPGLCCCTSCSVFHGADGRRKPPSAKHRALPTASLHPCPAASCLPPLPALAEAPSLSTPHPSSWIC